jgi:hypothetical protein
MANLKLPQTTSSSIGIIYKGGRRWMHNFPGRYAAYNYPCNYSCDSNFMGGNNFIGLNSGNFTMNRYSPVCGANTAVADCTLTSIISGVLNSAYGWGALAHFRVGWSNTAIGGLSQIWNYTGVGNTTVGESSLSHCTNCNDNVDLGINAGEYKYGSFGVSVGQNACFADSGQRNISIGYGSRYGHYNNYPIWPYFWLVGSDNIAIGGNSQALAHKAHGDISIGANNCSVNDSTNNIILGNTAFVHNTLGFSDYVFGTNGMNLSVSGYRCFAAGTSALNSCNGHDDQGIGEQTQYGATTAYNCVSLGSNSLFSNSTGYGLIGIGFGAGYNETRSNHFYLNNQVFGTLASDTTYSLLYGTMGASPAAQQLTINGTLNINSSAKIVTTNITATNINTNNLSVTTVSTDSGLVVESGIMKKKAPTFPTEIAFTGVLYFTSAGNRGYADYTITGSDLTITIVTTNAVKWGTESINFLPASYNALFTNCTIVSGQFDKTKTNACYFSWNGSKAFVNIISY